MKTRLFISGSLSGTSLSTCSLGDFSTDRCLPRLFSFPVEQTALDKGTLLTWTKGFNCKNAIGQDVVKLLQDALDAKHIKVKCSALVNDVSACSHVSSYMRVSLSLPMKTVGTLLSRSYQHGPALIGCIFGTGTNGAYIDRVETIQKLGEQAIAEAKKGGPTAGEYMVVNTEWGAIDNGVSKMSESSVT